VQLVTKIFQIIHLFQYDVIIVKCQYILLKWKVQIVPKGTGAVLLGPLQIIMFYLDVSFIDFIKLLKVFPQ
jgi:hypothetical protein